MQIVNFLKRYRATPKDQRKNLRTKAVDYLYGRLWGSQFGEDRSIQEYLATLGKSSLSYLDIGANHPRLHSNTYQFYRQGSKGVLVDANPRICAKLKKCRPHDTVVNVGVLAEGEGEMTLSVMNIDGLSTLDATWKEHLLDQGLGEVSETLKVKTLGINRLLAANFPHSAPDFVSIDIEGLDYAVLEAWDFSRWRPLLFCIETGILTKGKYLRDDRFDPLMLDNGYIPLFQTFSNTIYRQAD